MDYTPLTLMADIPSKATETICCLLNDNVGKVATIVDEFFSKVSKTRREQFRHLICSFTDAIKKSKDLGCVIRTFGRQLNETEIDINELPILLKDIIEELESIQKDFVEIDNNLEQLQKDVSNDIIWAKGIMYISIGVAIVGIGLLVTVLTLGIGAAVSCPVLCSFLVAMGLETTGAVVVCAGTGAGLLGLIGIGVSSKIIHDSSQTKEQLTKVIEVATMMNKVAVEVKQKLEKCDTEMKKSKKDREKILAIRSRGPKLYEAGENLINASEGALCKLYEIQANMAAKPRQTESCVVL